MTITIHQEGSALFSFRDNSPDTNDYDAMALVRAFQTLPLSNQDAIAVLFNADTAGNRSDMLYALFRMCPGIRSVIFDGVTPAITQRLPERVTFTNVDCEIQDDLYFQTPFSPNEYPELVLRNSRVWFTGKVITARPIILRNAPDSTGALASSPPSNSSTGAWRGILETIGAAPIPVTERRGYTISATLVTRDSTAVLIHAGCRRFTLMAAYNHWVRSSSPDDHRGQDFAEALHWVLRAYPEHNATFNAEEHANIQQLVQRKHGIADQPVYAMTPHTQPAPEPAPEPTPVPTLSDTLIQLINQLGNNQEVDKNALIEHLSGTSDLPAATRVREMVHGANIAHLAQALTSHREYRRVAQAVMDSACEDGVAQLREIFNGGEFITPDGYILIDEDDWDSIKEHLSNASGSAYDARCTASSTEETVDEALGIVNNY